VPASNVIESRKHRRLLAKFEVHLRTGAAIGHDAAAGDVEAQLARALRVLLRIVAAYTRFTSPIGVLPAWSIAM
jgi:hypothetical protein